ncbi:RNA polymerase sigma factor [Planctomicrobium sp. SH527]|uniref:RNA polymerase sigma factor n=1 Tax=Planctomicrobium sp. SH527 TaxID=3448123 RepID=UPI003F5B35A7
MIEDCEQLGLVRKAQSGDRDAFGRLVTEYEAVVFAIAFRRLRNRSEALEVTQDIFLRAMRKLPQLREPERFAGWLKRIAVRMAINRAVRRPRESFQSPETLTSVAQQPTPFDRAIHVEQAQQVRVGLKQLRALDRDTLTAFYFEGQSLKEMSDRFSSPVGTIKRRLHTARHRLKEALGDLQPA